MCDKHHFIEERNDAKVSRSILESNGSREGVVDFNQTVAKYFTASCSAFFTKSKNKTFNRRGVRIIETENRVKLKSLIA